MAFVPEISTVKTKYPIFFNNFTCKKYNLINLILMYYTNYLKNNKTQKNLKTKCDQFNYM